MSHPFVFDFRKAVQAIGVLLRLSPGRRMNYMRLLKLLYIADRESLRDRGHPITGDRVVAMQRGPVLGGVYNLIRGHHVETPRWGKYFSVCRYEIVLTTEEPGVDELNRYEIEKLEEIARQHEDKDEWDMVEETHQFPEWIKNDPGESSRPIPLEDVLEAIGRSQDLGEITREEQQREVFDKIFNAPAQKPQGASR